MLTSLIKLRKELKNEEKQMQMAIKVILSERGVRTRFGL